jgi:hypothetical protein
MIIIYIASKGTAKLDLSVFADLFTFLGDLANIIGFGMEHYAYDELEEDKNEQEKQEFLNEQQMNPLHEAQQALFVDNDGNSLDYTKSSRIVSINPMSPSQYISNSVEYYNLVGFGDFDFDAKFDNIYEYKVLTT